MTENDDRSQVFLHTPPMKWEDVGLVLSARKFSERDATVTLLTKSHGLWRALVKGGFSKNNRAAYEPGNLLLARWNARLSEHMGNFSCELLEQNAALLMQDRLKLTMLSSVCALLEGILQERDPHPVLFEKTRNLLEQMKGFSPPLRGGDQGEGEKPYPQAHVRFAKELRHNSTEAEKKLWYALRQKQLGMKFRRQQPIGGYIVDFVCFETKLIIELDGGQHNWQQQKDEKRTAFLEAEGYQVLRFWNHEVIQNMEGVLLSIQNFLQQHPPPARSDASDRPLPSREGLTESYARFELALLAEAGYGLDLSHCAATGSTHDLLYISPKTGRAVCKEAGAPYHEKMLPLPPLLRDASHIPEPAEILDALRVTGYFLQRWLYEPRGRKLPLARERLVELVEGVGSRGSGVREKKKYSESRILTPESS